MNWRPLLLVLLSFSASAQNWVVTQHAPMPEPVTNNAVCEGFNSEGRFVYSFAGIDSTLIHSGIHLKSFRYNIDTDVWDTLPPLPDTQGKIACSASRVGNIIYIIGGYHVMANGNEISSSKVHRFDVVSNQFLPDGANIPIAIDDQVQAVWKDSLIYVITGWSNSGNVTDVQIYNPSLNQWSVGTSVPVPDNYRVFGASGTIVGDTIYYFGGAGNSNSFAAREQVRKGVINANNPTQITWSTFEFDANVKGYRNACTSSFGNVHWIGGSDVTYNFDGIAYNGSGVVAPVNRNLVFVPETGIWNADDSNSFPMDLRGLANISDSVKYIVGGMLVGQVVSNEILRLEWRSSPASLPETDLNWSMYPNPAKDFIVISSNENIRSYTISEFTGRVVAFSNQYSGGLIPLHGLSSGPLLLSIRVGNTTSKKLFIHQ